MERKIIVQKVLDSAKSHAREAIGGLALLTAAAIACKGGQGSEVKTTPTAPPATPTPEVTIGPTATATAEATATSESTPEPTQTPATFEEVLEAYQSAYAAYAKLYSAEFASLPENATFATIESYLRTCKEENIPPEASYASYVIAGCTGIPQETQLIPHRERIPEFAKAHGLLTQLISAKIDSLNERHMFPDDHGQPTFSLSEKDLTEYKQAVIDQMNSFQ